MRAKGIDESFKQGKHGGAQGGASGRDGTPALRRARRLKV